jgi:Na+-transporting NADH:ubiquinone oxidoreductase subunit A
MLIEINRGLDVDVSGAPEQTIDTGPEVGRVALLGGDYRDLRPSLEVDEGARVKAGDTLFSDRARPRIRFVAPASGRVHRINRGPRRTLVSVVIDVDADDWARRPARWPARLDVADEPSRREEVVELLLGAGLWPALRSRPFDRVADPERRPAALLITAIDTRPLAPDPAVVIGQRSDDFAAGARALASLTPATYICSRAGAGLPRVDAEGVVGAEFSGAHPAGLVGTHIGYLCPNADEVWHVGYQDVLAMGRLLTSGELCHERVVSVAGPGAVKPRLLRTRVGADLSGLLQGEAEDGCDVIAGSVLSGRTLTPASEFLGRYDSQLSLLCSAAARRRWLDVVWPRSAPPTASAAHVSGMLPVESFDRVWPFQAPVAPLLRALLTLDTELAGSLGSRMLVEEDLALCAYVCPARLDYGAALRATLHEIERGR